MKSRLGSGRFHGSKSPVARGPVPVLVAGRSDDVPGAGAEGAEGVEGHGLRVEVQLLLLDGLVVAPLPQVTILVGSERLLRCRLVVKVSVDQEVGDADVQDGGVAVGAQVAALQVRLLLRKVSRVAAQIAHGGELAVDAGIRELLLDIEYRIDLMEGWFEAISACIG